MRALIGSSGLRWSQIDSACGAVQRRSEGGHHLHIGRDVSPGGIGLHRLADVMAMADGVMVRIAPVGIRRHLVAITIRMHGQFNARDAAPRHIGSMSHA